MYTIAEFARRFLPCLAIMAALLAGNWAAAAEMTDYAPVVEFAGTGSASVPVPVPTTVPASGTSAKMGTGTDAEPVPMAVPPVSELNWRALGPFFERRGTADGERELRAFLRPIYTDFHTKSGTTSGRDILWPIGFTRNRPDSEFQFFFPFLHTKPHHEADGLSADRWWLMPIIFYGHDNELKPYFGLFPLGGRISNIFTFEQVNFWLFPVYVGSKKKTFEAHTWLWPVYSRTKGECVDKFRVWPFYGRATFKARTAETTGVEPQEERRFYAWPFFHTNRKFPVSNDPLRRESESWFLFPLYGQEWQADKNGVLLHDSWTALWPFFSGEACNIKGREKERIYCPWPFIRLEKSNSKDGNVDKKNFWPFYGLEKKQGYTTGYVCWPFWWHGTAAAGEAVTRNWSALAPLYWSSELWRGDAKTPEKPAVLEQNFKQIWPLFSYDCAKDKSRLAVLALWPRRTPDGVSRNYAPLWTLYSREKAGPEIRHEAIWGWWKLAYNAPQPMRWSLSPFAEYHREDNNGGWYLSIGKGLLGWTRANGEKHGRFLWFFKW